MASPMSIDHIMNPISASASAAASSVALQSNSIDQVMLSPPSGGRRAMSITQQSETMSHNQNAEGEEVAKEEGGEEEEGGEKKEGEEGEEGEEEEEEEEEEFVPRRSTRIRKPVMIHKPPPKNSDSESELSEPVRRRRRRKSKAATAANADGDEENEGGEKKEGEETSVAGGGGGGGAGASASGEQPKPKPKRKRKRSVANEDEMAIDQNGGDEQQQQQQQTNGAQQQPAARKRSPKKKKVADGEGAGDVEGGAAGPGAGEGVKVNGENGEEGVPKKRRRTKKPAKEKEDEEMEDAAAGSKSTAAPPEGEGETGASTSAKKGKGRKSTAAAVVATAAPNAGTGTGTSAAGDGDGGDGGDGGGDTAGDGEEPSKPKRVRKPRVTEPVVYVIPDVEHKTTTYRGRLGYACINTVLRTQKPPVFSSRTCRIDTITKFGIEKVKELGLQNLKDLRTMVEWNEKNNIRFMRMSSDMFPFASHPQYGYDLSYCAQELKEVGDLAKQYGHRLTSHPGQFTQLASPKENVVEQSIRELEYHAEMMDRMGLDADSIMIIHMGGVYGDKEGTLKRFRENWEKKVPDRVKRRLVLENDEICYNADDLLKVCPQLGIPIVFDYHHDAINPSRRRPAELIPLINQTWHTRGIKPKQHLSSPRPGAVTAMELRAHADRCTELPADLPDDMDLMIEAKDKEQAVFELYRIYGLQDVIWENLRPPSDDQTMRTKGRKSVGTSTKKAKKDQTDGAPTQEVEKPIDPEMIDELADDDDLDL